MGTCVSKCYPCFPCHPTPCDSTAGISQASPAVHPHPSPGEAGAATASPTTTTSSSSSSVPLVASTSSSGSSSSSSSYLWRPREQVLLPSSTTTTTMSSWDREWDVVVLDPKSKSSDSGRCKPIVGGSGSGRHRLATPKRARSVSPLAPGSYHKQHKKKTRNNKTEVSQQSLGRRRRLLEAKTSSDAAAPVRVTAEDDLTNPIISMDCFIFL